MNTNISIFVSGGTPETVMPHVPDFLDYLRSITFKTRNPEANVQTERVFKNNAPANIKMMIFAPDVIKIGYCIEHHIPMEIKVFPFDEI